MAISLIDFLFEIFAFLDKLGYVGLAITSLLSSALFIPFPLPVIVFTMGANMNPILVAIIASLFSTIGSSVKYLLGLGGKEILQKKYEKEITKVRQAFERYNFFWWLFAVGLTPFPDDPVSIFCGIVKYDFKKYFLSMLLGRLVLYTIVSVAGYYSISSLVKIINVIT
ncbi:MAG: VTT domain-containing protein [Candidatus Aenigmatarchaeota archaeon]|nr:VTT domain-containing protein [Candidatus Aenigmarchaeota archaeon]